jgi:endo-1,4-beta-D-glucanase Y
VATWKSFAACGATVASLETAYTTWKATYFKECGSEAYVLKDDESPNVTVSEGIAYGMLITAALGKSADFGKLAAFYKKRLDGNGLMNWKYPASCSGSATGQNAATDADLDVALAFLIADKAGFGGTYLADAKTLIGKLKAATVKPCSPGSLVMAGDNWGSCSQLNPSYFSPGHFRTFAQVTGDTSWNSVASASYTLLTKYQNTYGGFVPDWGNDSGTGVADPNKGSNPVGLYGYEACRTPWRIALDYGWYKSAESKAFLDTFNTKIIAPTSGPSVVVARADWKDNEKNSCHVGGYALVGTAIDQATADKYYKSWQNAYLAGDKGTGAYYKQTLKLLFQITAAGRLGSGQ